MIRLQFAVGVPLLFLFACSGPRTQGQGTVDTTLVFIAEPGSMQSFPQVADSTRMLKDGSLLPDASAPPCPSPARTDTLSWPRSEILGTRYRLSIKLPPGFAGSGTHWAQLRKTPDGRLPYSFDIFVNSRRGYARPGVGPYMRQVSLRECTITAPIGLVRVAAFVLESSGRDQTQHWIVAHAWLRADTALQVIGKGLDSLTQAQYLTALGTITFVPR